MTTAVSQAAPLAGDPPPVSPRRFRALRRFCRNRFALGGAIYIGVLVLMGVLAPLIAPHDPNHQDLLHRFQRPGGSFLLGTDDFGRDQLSRLVFGVRASLEFSLLAVAFSLVLGLPQGLAAGYAGGRLDSALSRFNEMLMAVPALVLPIVVVGVVGPGLTHGAFAIGFVSAPRFFRVVRAVTLDVKGETYIEAARALGATTPRIITTNVLPNAMGALIVQIALSLGLFVTAEASLSFIGLGIPPPTASWGSMLQTAAANMTQAPFLVYPPGILIGSTVLAYMLIGDGLRSAFGTTRSAVSEGSIT